MMAIGTGSGTVLLADIEKNLSTAEDSEMEILGEIPLHSNTVTSLAFHRDLLFSGCGSGNILTTRVCLARPQDSLQDLANSGPKDSHRKSAIMMAKQNDLETRVLFLGGSKIQNSPGEGSGEEVQGLTMDDTVLILRSYFDERLAEIDELNERMARIRAETEYSLNQKDSEMKERLRFLQERNDAKVEELQTKYIAMVEKLSEAQRSGAVDRDELTRKFSKNLLETEKEYEDKLKVQYEREEKRLEEIDLLRQDNDRRLSSLKRKYESKIADLENMRGKEIRKWRCQYEEVRGEMERDAAKFEEAMKQQETEYEGEISQLREEQSRILQLGAERSATARAEQVALKHSMARLQRVNVEKEDELETLREKVRQMKNKMERSRASAEKATEQLDHHRMAITRQDKMLLRAEKESKNLQNFRSVLFRRVKQLEEEKAPLKEQVDSLRMAVRDIYGEFVSEFETKKSLEEQLDERGRSLTKARSQTIALREKNAGIANEVGKLLQEVRYVMSESQSADDRDDRRLLARLGELVHREEKKMAIKRAKESGPHEDVGEKVLLETIDDDDGDSGTALAKELLHQRDLLFAKARKLTEVNTKLAEDGLLGRRRMMADNSAMIRELNELRLEKKELHKTIENLESKIASMSCNVSHLNEKKKDKSVRKSKSLASGLTPYQQHKMEGEEERVHRRVLALQARSRNSSMVGQPSGDIFSEHAETLEGEGYRLSRLQFDYITESHPTTQGSSTGLRRTQGSEGFSSTSPVAGVKLPQI
ncbi:hypothetical protein FOZ60_007110 [Perkinsus olseni]|uniref:WD repeat domain 65 n=1 Tax=Perkinsus olseni TaxID=32597 RepID=A0A7J6NM22_PEROL|nr:hypothetical protein FOZ60_007110 [Perkinsus olseni]